MWSALAPERLFPLVVMCVTGMVVELEISVEKRAGDGGVDRGARRGHLESFLCGGSPEAASGRAVPYTGGTQMTVPYLGIVIWMPVTSP